MAEMVYQTVYKQIFNGRMEDRDYAIGIYLDHHSPRFEFLLYLSNRVLTYDVKEGW